jgi:hypothetical protein
MRPEISIQAPAPLAKIARTMESVTRVLVTRVLYDELPLFGVFGVQLVASWLVCRATGRSPFVGLGYAYVEFLSAVPLYGAGALAVALVHLRQTVARDDSMRGGYLQAWRELRASLLRPDYVASVVVAFVVLPVSLTVFSSAKRAIPLVHPFAWDRRLERIGRAISGGRHLWEWLTPVIANARVMHAASWFYHFGWPFAILGAAVVVALSPPTALRTRYLIASVLTWFLVGTVAALILSSAGPPYYTAVTGQASPFAPLFLMLKREAVPSLAVQEALWNAYRDGIDRFGFGISAMPSVHVAAATLLACVGFAVHRVLGYVLTLAAILTLLSSVMLGWHYGVDGYVAAAMALVVWWLSGKIVALRPRSEVRR